MDCLSQLKKGQVWSSDKGIHEYKGEDINTDEIKSIICSHLENNTNLDYHNLAIVLNNVKHMANLIKDEKLYSFILDINKKLENGEYEPNPVFAVVEGEEENFFRAAQGTEFSPTTPTEFNANNSSTNTDGVDGTNTVNVSQGICKSHTVNVCKPHAPLSPKPARFLRKRRSGGAETGEKCTVPSESTEQPNFTEQPEEYQENGSCVGIFIRHFMSWIIPWYDQDRMGCILV